MRIFLDKIARTVKNGNIVIVSNMFNGIWIKIPNECYNAVLQSTKDKISIEDTLNVFKENEDRNYYIKVIESLDKIGLIGEVSSNKDSRCFIPYVSISVTNKCNLDCDYCCKDSNIYGEETLSTEDLKSVIYKASKLKPINITISGGEALLRKDFNEFIDYAKTVYSGKLILSTNATLINDKNAEYIVNNFHAIEISLDAYDDETCTLIRGKGVFNKVIRAVKLLKSYNAKFISLSMVVGKNNFNEQEKFIELNKKLGTKHRIRYFSAFGRGDCVCDKYLDENTLFYRPVDHFDNIDINKLKTGHCNAGVNQIYFNHEGDIYLCPNLSHDDFKICNVKEFDDEAVERLYNRDFDAFKKFDYIKENKIRDCKHCDINIFCNTCPAHTDMIKDNDAVFRKYCDSTIEGIHKKIW
ncbi:MAG: radical SAM protein [Romboutsia sp.]